MIVQIQLSTISRWQDISVDSLSEATEFARVFFAEKDPEAYLDVRLEYRTTPEPSRYYYRDGRWVGEGWQGRVRSVFPYYFRDPYLLARERGEPPIPETERKREAREMFWPPIHPDAGAGAGVA